MTKINPGNLLYEKRIPERPVSPKMSLYLNEDNTHLCVKIGICRQHFRQNNPESVIYSSKLDFEKKLKKCLEKIGSKIKQQG